jgi:hypothetical protein
MPYFYGKTPYSFSQDVYKHYNGIFSYKESYQIAKIIHEEF